jgi:hypothetical protein
MGVDSLIVEHSAGKTDGDGDEIVAPVQSEVLATLAAFEILYPFEFRLADLNNVEDGNMTHASLAMHYEIPEFAVAHVLHPDYMVMATEQWEKLK